MKGFGKCLKMDLQSVWGEVTVACATVLIFFLFDANPLLIPISYYSPSYFFTIPTVMIVAYCFFRVFKRLFYTCMFTDGAVLYKTLPISEKCDAMSKFVTAAAALMILQFILLALQWYVPSLPLKNTKRSPLWAPFSLEICDLPCIYCV